MRHGRCAVLAFGVVLAAAVNLRADDAVARAAVDRAVKAHGGADILAKFPASTVQFKGTFHGMGQAIPFTGEVASHKGDRHRFEVAVEAGGQKFQLAHVLAGDKGWVKANGATKEMDKDELTEAREEAHAAWVATLAPLKDKAFELSLIGEVQVEGKAAAGVKVSHKDRRDVNLYFDKETGLLVKTESRVKDEGSGQEVTDEAFLSDYKDVQGTKQPMKVVVKRDGKLYVEGEVTDITLAESLDVSVFAKP